MKKLIGVVIVPVLAATLTLPSCDELFGDLTKFDLDYSYFEFTIIPQSAPGGYNFLTRTENSDLTDLLEDNGFDEGNVDEIKLKEVTFEVINEDTDITFNGIGSFGASFLDANNLETEVANLNPVPENVREVTLNPLGEDISKFLKESQYTFLAFGYIDEVFTDTIEVRAKIKYEVKAKL